jgi:hypothetical protein
MKLDDWVPVEVVGAVVRHGLGVSAVAIVFAIVGRLVQYLHSGWLLLFWTEFDNLLIAALLIWLAYEMAVVLWKGRPGGPHAFVLA